MSNYESLPRAFTFAPANVNANGFATAATGATWPLTATVSGDGLAHRVTITNNTANSHTGQTITIVGFDQNGAAQTETITGPAASVAVTSTGYYSSLTSVTPSATFGADTVGIGWNNQFASPSINLNYMAEDLLTLVGTVTGTINFTLNQSFDKFDNVPAPTITWAAIVSSQTAAGIWQTTGGATLVQVVVGSYSSGAVLKINANATFLPVALSGGSSAASNVNIAQIGGTATSLGQKAMAASLPVVLASDQSGIIGVAYSSPLTITRPANQTPYTAGDVVGGALTFPLMGPSGGRIMLTSDQLELDLTAIPTGMTSFTLYLYNVTPPSALADNAAWDLPSGDRASYLGYVTMGTPVDLGSTCYVETNIINKQIKLAGTSLFGYLVTAGGYTPAANSEVYVATLHAIGLGL